MNVAAGAFDFVFLDETPVIREFGSGPASAVALGTTATANGQSASQMPIYDPSFLTNLPGPYYLYIWREKDPKKISLPEAYTAAKDKFDEGRRDLVTMELGIPNWIVQTLVW